MPAIKTVDTNRQNVDSKPPYSPKTPSVAIVFLTTSIGPANVEFCVGRAKTDELVQKRSPGLG